MSVDDLLKKEVRDFWERSSCGEVYARGVATRDAYKAQSNARYALEPYIRPFARFDEGSGRDVLEIGVGMGADHIEWAKSGPRSLTGIDLTPRAVAHTRARLTEFCQGTRVLVGDGENLPFPNDSFDIVYSWGVLHHSPDTAKAISEVLRVLRPGGDARIMIYHKYSLVGYMLWLRYALLTGRPWLGLNDVYARYLESPGTKAFTVEEARPMFRAFSAVLIRSQLSFGDLLEGAVGQRHGSRLLNIAKAFWPRAIIKRYFHKHGLMLLVEAKK